jgi:single-strand DNA-binding protein
MFSKLIVVGHLGNNPEMRYMPNGQAVANFSMATTRRWTDGQGNPAEETTWLRVSVWGKQAENANQYLQKGSKVLVEGRLRPDAATGGPRTFTRNDGTVGASYEVTAETIQYLDSRSESEGREASSQTASSQTAEDDDIPF